MRRLMILSLALLMLLAGCGRTGQAKELPPSPAPLSHDLMLGVEAQADIPEAALSPEGARAVTGFGLGLLQRCMAGENTLVSPLSVIEALAMTANGAAGDTLAQMEDTLGMDLEALNAYLAAYARSLPDSEGGSVRMANGIWLNSGAGLAVERDFLQANASYYGAGVYEQPFDDAALADINGFVSEHTAGRIPSILDQLSPGAAAVLVNALAFDGVWEEIYREDQLRSGLFTAAGGTEQQAQFMESVEDTYIEDEHAAGFMKYYQGCHYAFAALLPEEGMSLADYAASLTGEKLHGLLEGAEKDTYVETAIPKFSAEYSAELAGVLAAMGMADAFDPESADFSRLGSCETGPLYIDRVAHRTFVQVDEAGTKAGAATAVEVREAGMLAPERLTVRLDRPFLYMIVDCRQNVPIFLGAVTELD